MEWWPKHKIARVVPLTPVAAEVLTKAESPGPWIFEVPVKGGKWPGWRLRFALKRRLRVCRIDHGTPHTFRHTCASFLANTVKMAVTVLQRFLGHRSLESTMRYLHTKNEDVAMALAAADFTALSAPPAITTAVSATLPAASTKEVPTNTNKLSVAIVDGDVAEAFSQEESK